MDWIDSQLVEIETLKSLYSDEELVLDEDCKAIIEDHLQCKLDFMDDSEEVANESMRDLNIGFTIRLNSLLDEKGSLEVRFQLPHTYPESEKPIVYILTDSFKNKQSASAFKNHLHSFVEDCSLSEPIIFNIILWIQEEIVPYLLQSSADCDDEPLTQREHRFCRMWIYSHHIYSKFKRRDIINWATELKLRGFSMCGKPGLICLEGYMDDVEDFWARIRRLNWKRLVMKHREDFIHDSYEQLQRACKFEEFEEKFFTTRPGKGSTHSFHSDIGELRHFLQERDSLDIFEMIFGVEGKNQED